MRDLLTVQSGVYSYIKGDKTENKTRGFSAGSVATMSDLDLEAISNRMELVARREHMEDNVTPACSEMVRGRDHIDQRLGIGRRLRQ